MAETPTTPRDVTSRRGRLKRWLLPSGWRARLRRSGQLVLLLLLVLVVVLAAALFVGLGTRNGRQALLQVALRSADSALPGELSVAAPRWPRLGRLELEDILWTEADDTLATAHRLVLDFSVAELLRREIHIHEAALDGAHADLSAIQRAMADTSGLAEAEAEAEADHNDTEPVVTAAALPFFNQGAIPGLPSVALDSLQVTEFSLNLATGPPARLVELSASVDLRAGHEPRVNLAILLLPRPDLSMNWRIAGRGGSDNEDIELALHPLHIEVVEPAARPQMNETQSASEVQHAGEASAAAPAGSLTIAKTALKDLICGRSSWAELRLDDLLITGAVGNYRLSALLDADGDARIDLAAAWPAPPAILDEILAARLDSLGRNALPELLAAAWSGGGPLSAHLQVDLQGRATTTYSPEEISLQAALQLPGPAQLAPLLPEEILVQDLDGLDGQLRAHADLRSEDVRYELNLNLGATTWLDRAVLAASGQGKAVRIDTLAVAMSGAEIDLKAALSDSAFDLAGRVYLSDTELLARWQRPELADRDLRFLLDAQISGPVPLPDLGEDPWGVAVRIDTLDLQFLGTEANLSGSLADGEIDLNCRLLLPDAELLTLWPQPAMEDLDLQLALDLQASGTLPLPDLRVDLKAAATTPTATLPELTFQATHHQRHLEIALSAPAGLAYQEHSLDRLVATFSGDLADSLRSLSGAFRLAAMGAEAQALLKGELATGPPFQVAMDSLQVGFRALNLAAQRPFRIAFDPATSSLDLQDMELSGDLGTIRGDGLVSPDSLTLGLEFALQAAAVDLIGLLPPDSGIALPSGTVRLSGDLQLGGDARQPAASAALQVEIVEHELLEELEARVTLDLAPTSGLAAQWRIVQRDTTWVEGQASLPVELSLQPFAWRLASEENLSFDLNTQQLALARFKPFLPPGIRLDGWLACQLSIAGRGKDAALDGHIVARKVQIRLADGSWFATGGQVGLAGTVAAPSAEGRIDLEGGLIRLPELPPSLLPTEGSALLWDNPAPGDSVVVLSATGAVPVGLAAEPAPHPLTFLPEIEIALHCPGDLWLRGHGLDVELAGDLSATVREGLPRLGGQLKAVRGDLKFLGRVFNVDRGLITFYADEPHLDPQLDIVLSVRLNSILYRIEVTGRSQKPELILSSEPTMPEGDIISGLLFGKPMNDLDSGQTDLMEDRSREILASYGAAVLGTKMARQLGVDVITLKQPEKSDEASRLMVGKYLNPRVMVSYEQVLDDRSAFYVGLSYRLLRNLKVETTASQGAESGIELMWSKDY